MVLGFAPGLSALDTHGVGPINARSCMASLVRAFTLGVSRPQPQARSHDAPITDPVGLFPDPG